MRIIAQALPALNTPEQTTAVPSRGFIYWSGLRWIQQRVGEAIKRASLDCPQTGGATG